MSSSVEELKELASKAEASVALPVGELAAKARRVHVLFNNCHGDKAQRNAAQFRRLLA